MDSTHMFSEDYLLERKADVSRKLQENIVLLEELKTIKKCANIYKQQPNSNIFFETNNRDKVSLQCQDSIVKLKEELKNIELMISNSS